jgi:predicted outer membrane repeat protein
VFIAPTILYVDSSATGTNDGVDWKDAYNSLSNALKAAIPGESLHVAGGTYSPTLTNDRTKSFDLKSGIAIYGGYAGLAIPSSPDERDTSSYTTILSGNIGSPATNTDNSYHVIVAYDVDASGILDGVTIEDGSATSNISNSTNQDGGGIFVELGEPVLNNCIFTNNIATSQGGAGYLSSCSPIFSNCIASNDTAGRGGAFEEDTAPATYENCQFISNSAGVAGAVENGSGSSQVINCDFINNVSTKAGGGAILSWTSMSISGSLFEGNSSPSYNGGAIDTEDATLTITGCTFLANSCSGVGGAIHLFYNKSLVADCLFIGNSANEGGAIEADDQLVPTISNCTFVDNSATSGGGIYSSVSTNVTNCILWGNSANAGTQIYYSGIVAAVTYSDIQGGYAGTGNINSNPQFVRSPSSGPDGKWDTVDDDYGDLHLQFTSPCIDAGTNASIPAGITADLDGNPRIFDFPGVNNGAGAVVDMGAYELGYNLDEVIVPAGQTLALPSGGYAFSANSISLGNAATLDIADDSLTINYGTNADPAPTIASLISSAYTNGTWTGPGITSSASLNQPANVTSVGYYDNGSSVTIRRTWYGDANVDGVINADDLSLMMLAQTGAGPQPATRWQDGNFNYGTQITADDWSKFAYVNAYAKGQNIATATPALAHVQLVSASNLDDLLS